MPAGLFLLAGAAACSGRAAPSPAAQAVADPDAIAAAADTADSAADAGTASPTDGAPADAFLTDAAPEVPDAPDAASAADGAGAAEAGADCGDVAYPHWGAAGCACPEQHLALRIEVGGAFKVVCAADYPKWGIRPSALSPAPSDFEIHGDGRVTDHFTGLQWQAAAGDGAVTWAEAWAECDKLKLGGHLDWRLPTVEELASILDLTKDKDEVAIVDALDAEGEAYWTAIGPPAWPTGAWYVYFNYGDFHFGELTDPSRVRCVR